MAEEFLQGKADVACNLRNRIGEMSRPAWKGNVVPRPSKCRYCRWEPFCLTSEKPSRSRMAATSLGLRTGTSPTLRGNRNGVSTDEFPPQFRLSVF